MDGAFVYLEQVWAIGVEGVHGPFVPDPKQDEQAGGDAKRQAENVDGGETFVADQAPPGEFEIIVDHSNF